MRLFCYLIFVLLIVACSKENAGKYCPELAGTYDETRFIDPAKVAHIPQIRDTLAKYPELKITQIYEYWLKTGQLQTSVSCTIYYKQIPLTYGYTIRFISPDSVRSFGTIPRNLNMSVEPALSRNDAIAIAEKAVNFNSCPVSGLGISNVSKDSTPRYRLVWELVGTENKTPWVEMDAITGEIYFIYNIIND
jgi:hypothetical protein